MNAALDRWFSLTANGTTPRTEAVAGVTTYLALAYIVFVQPAVLSAAGMDFGAVMTATCLASAFGTLLMARLGNHPIAVRPAWRACRCHGRWRWAPWRLPARCSC